MSYFEHFFATSPMVEVSAAEAHSSGSYAELIDAPIAHYRTFFDHALQRSIYPDATPAAAITRFHAARYGNLPLWIVSPVVRDDVGLHFDIWYFDTPSAAPIRVHHDVGERTIETRHDEMGQVTGTLERRYNGAHEQIEAIHRDGSGNIVSIDD